MMKERRPNSGWKKCSCCPYGYHIDLDFVKYCESISNNQLMADSTRVPTRKRTSRKKRASMDVLLGLVNSTVTYPTMEMVHETTNGKVTPEPLFEVDTPYNHNGLDKAVHDFEETWRNSIKRKVTAGSKPAISEAEQCRRVLQDITLTTDLLDHHIEKENKSKSIFDMDKYCSLNTDGHLSTYALHVIRQHMATCLDQTRELEEKVKIIPNLENQLSMLKIDNSRLNMQLQETSQALLAEKSKPEPMPQQSPRTRTVAVGNTIIRRDIGICHTPVFSKHVESQTEEDEVDALQSSTDSLSLKAILHGSKDPTRHINSSTMTDFKLADLYTKSDVEKLIKREISSYESDRCRKIKSLQVNSVSQTDGPEQKIQKDFSATAKPLCSTSGTNTLKIRSHDSLTQVGEGDVTPPCLKCTVKKVAVATSFPEEQNRISLRTLGNRSKSFDISPRKTTRSVGCGNDKFMTSSKSTDTHGLRPRKDTSTNTLKVNTVNAALDPLIMPDIDSNKLQEQDSSFKSRIPRPTSLKTKSKYPPPKPKHKFTPTKSHKQSRIRNEGYSSDSESEEGVYVLENTENVAIENTPLSLFQPIQVTEHIKKEPSKEMKAAMKVLNDYLLSSSQPGNIPTQMKSATNIIQQEWFKVSSTAEANPLDVEDYLDSFEELSCALLEYVVNITDATGNTAMHYAVSHGNFDVVSILLDSKVCNINVHNAAGYTCIMLVALTEVNSDTARHVVKRLFQMADVNIRAKQHGQTALMLAAAHGRIETSELLLECGADINIQDEDGSTALMCAVEHGYDTIVKLLVAQPDCDLTIKDFDGSNALAIALETGNRDIAVILYAREHFSSSPHAILNRRTKTPTLKTPPPHSPSSPMPPKKHNMQHSI